MAELVFADVVGAGDEFTPDGSQGEDEEEKEAEHGNWWFGTIRRVLIFEQQCW